MKKSSKLYFCLCACRDQEKFDSDKVELTNKDIVEKLKFKLFEGKFSFDDYSLYRS